MAPDPQNSQYDSPPFGLSSGGLATTNAPGLDTSPATPERGVTQPVYSPSTDTVHVGTSPQSTTGMGDGPDQYQPGGGGFTANDGFTSDAAHVAGKTMARHPNSTAGGGDAA